MIDKIIALLEELLAYFKAQKEIIPCGKSDEPRHPDYRWEETNNFSYRNGVKITGIVLHIMEGTYEGTISWFKNRDSRVSAHYCISKNGDLCMMVLPANKAWHAYGHNNNTIGIEIEGKGEDELTELQEKKLVELCTYLMHEYGIPAKNITGHRFTAKNRGRTECPANLFGQRSEKALRDWVWRKLG